VTIIRNTQSRRRFLMNSSAIVAGSVVGSTLMAGPARNESISKLRLGLVTYQWGKDWTVPELIEKCTEAGIEGVELRSTHKHGVEIEIQSAKRLDVKKRFADSAVTLVGLGSACEYHAVDPAVVQKNIDETKAWIDLCREVGGSGVKVRPNGLPKEVPVDKTLEQIGKSLLAVGKYAADFGIQIRVEVHGAGTQEIPNMKAIMDVADHPNVVVCWNCNPNDMNGAGFATNYEMLEKWLGTVHIHDLREGKNNYPWKDLFPKLLQCKSEGFTGWCLLEDGTVPKDIVSALRENRVVFDQLTQNG
jgi:sugar phosphate isomerase/epimerase